MQLMPASESFSAYPSKLAFHEPTVIGALICPLMIDVMKSHLEITADKTCRRLEASHAERPPCPTAEVQTYASGTPVRRALIC